MNNYNYGPSHNIQHDTYGALDYPYPYCQHHPSGPAPLPALLPAPAPAATSPGKDFSIVVIDRTANRLPAGQSHTHIRQFKTSDSGAKMIEEITANTDAYKIMVHMKSEPRAIELIAAMNGQELQDREAYRLEVVVREKTPQVRRIPYRAIS
ncbi:hypothetical protein QQS21_011623 [Conoideocrella luteorostrata]|uniref:Uncharacterized protein n=1 Tax=Conoideocrella luteorostrata TaxID=1105319 RepID=A0AAJ0FTJ3_9HYPO|nr:hypothetical protein QQS21_011623 [Conoideocrella luteorostrata]